MAELPARHGFAWSDKDYENLLDAAAEGKSLSYMCGLLQRHENGVVPKLEAFGLGRRGSKWEFVVQPNPTSRYYGIWKTWHDKHRAKAMQHSYTAVSGAINNEALRIRKAEILQQLITDATFTVATAPNDKDASKAAAGLDYAELELRVTAGKLEHEFTNRYFERRQPSFQQFPKIFQTTKETPMKFEVVTNTVYSVDGTNLDIRTNSEIFEMITKAENRFKELTAIQTPSTKIAEEIAKHKATAVQLAAYVDNRDALREGARTIRSTVLEVNAEATAAAATIKQLTDENVSLRLAIASLQSVAVPSSRSLDNIRFGSADEAARGG